MIISAFFYVFMFLTLCSLMSTFWIIDNFGNVKVDQILFTLFSSLDGTDMTVVLSYVIIAIIVPLFCCLAVGYLHYRFRPARRCKRSCSCLRKYIRR